MKNTNSVIIKPNHSRKYGQTYRMYSVQEKLGINIVSASEENIEVISRFSNIIVFDTDDIDIYHIIQKMPEKRLISHFQLNPSYLGANSKLWHTSLKVLELSDKIIVPAKYLKNQLQDHLSNKTEFVLNGVNELIFIPKKSLNNLPTIGYVGRLTNSKGLQILNYIWGNCPKNIIFQIDSIDNKIPIKINNRILSNVSVTREKHITPFFDCLISTSLSEVAPLVIIEALVSGIQVIVTNSTPFIDELQNHFGCEIVQKVDLPEYLNNQERSKLNLSIEDVEKIGKKFIEKISKVQKQNMKRKKSIRLKALEMGLSSKNMCEQFEKIYNNYC